MMTGNTLFYDADLSQYLRGQLASLDAHVQKHVQTSHLTQTDGEIVASLLPGARVGALTVDFENPVREVNEAQVEVPDQFRGGTITINGIRATKAFPYKGHQDLFQMRPNSFTSVLPHANVSRSHVVLSYEGRSEEEAIKRAFVEAEKTLKFYVEASSRQVDAHDAALPDLLIEAVQRRRAHLGNVAKITDF